MGIAHLCPTWHQPGTRGSTGGWQVGAGCGPGSWFLSVGVSVTAWLPHSTVDRFQVSFMTSPQKSCRITSTVPSWSRQPQRPTQVQGERP